MNYLIKIFIFQRASDMLKTVYNTNDRKKNNDLVNVIKSGLGDLKNEIENTSEEGKENEKPNDFLSRNRRTLVNCFLAANKYTSFFNKHITQIFLDAKPGNHSCIV